MESCNITLDAKELETALDELVNFKSQSPDLYFEIIERLSEFVRFEQQSTVGTTLTIALKPSDSFRDCLAALRANNTQRMLV